MLRTKVEPRWAAHCTFLLCGHQKSCADVETKVSLADRMKVLQEKEEQWKSRGKGAANDSRQFTVAGRMAKKGGSVALR